MGRPPKYGAAMSVNERVRRWRARHRIRIRLNGALATVRAALEEADADARQVILRYLVGTSAPSARLTRQQPRGEPRRKALRWKAGEREATGIAADDAEYYIGRNPKTARFEITFYADETAHPQFLVDECTSMDEARIAAEEHNADR